MQALAGRMDLTGEPARPPTTSALSLADFTTGIVTSASILVGVHAARRDGRGTDYDVNVFVTAISFRQTLGRPQCAPDDRLADSEGRFAHRALLIARMDQVIGMPSTAEWV